MSVSAMVGRNALLGGGPGGVRLSVDSTTFLLSVYNLQQKFEQYLHLHKNP